MARKTTPPAKPLLIFDFDGTLANTLETGIAIYNEIAPGYKLIPITISEAQELRKLNTRALLDHLGISRIMAVKVGAHIKKLLHDRMEQVEIINGTDVAIRKLYDAGYRLGILSSNSAGNIRTFMKRYELLDCFSFFEAGVSLFGKPQRIKKVLRKEKIGAEHAMYIGDETRDMEAARDSHVAGIAVCWGANGREAMLTEDPAYCIDQPKELLTCADEFAAK
ncbi:HAD-IA family hydrolase [Verrucomicrobiales bacterium]|nr:HAD-IA family hydrolase [Verrucomicrobiales bacterium]MDC0276485.1 HAD-IA family hydrolase [Verrucomicrobiales bacterium]